MMNARIPTVIHAMTGDELERSTIRFGADLSRWPVDERARAEALLARDGAARRLLAQTAALERRISDAAALRPASDAADAARVVAALFAAPLPRQGRRLPVRWLPEWLIALDLSPAWPSIAALAGMAVLGFMVGTSGVEPVLGRAAGGGRGAPGTDVSAVVFEPGPLGEGVL